ncbi:MAG: serine hydrolase domain-containing protein [Acidobacteriota bacterium]
MLSSKPILQGIACFFLSLTPIVGECQVGSCDSLQEHRGAISSEIEHIVGQAIDNGSIPGAVVYVGCRDEVILHRAYGRRSLVPAVESMTPDTLFDLASLTKVVATAPALMILRQEGKIQLEDPVSRYLPPCRRGALRDVSIRHLLTHYSGLPSGFPPSVVRRVSSANVVDLICSQKLRAPPGRRFIYSDLGFILLGKVVENVSGMSLDQFATERLFLPMGMNQTRFAPEAALTTRMAPAGRRRDGSILRGRVQDRIAARLNGVAGHAGLFSTAEDMAIYCRWLLGPPTSQTNVILESGSVQEMTKPQSPSNMAEVRGLGWDIRSRYSSPRGCCFSDRSFGHTGYTGTSLWLDPDPRAFVVLLTNRLHPDGNANVTDLRSAVSDVVGRLLHPDAPVTAVSRPTDKSSPIP